MLLQVLLVEDSPGDVRLTQEALREVNPPVRLHVASDGAEAMAFLADQGHAAVRAQHMSRKIGCAERSRSRLGVRPWNRSSIWRQS